MAASQLERILKAERSWPRDPSRSNQIVAILVANKLDQDALRIARSTNKQFPQNYEAWKVLSEIPKAPREERNSALFMMKTLDPRNPSLQ